VSSIAATHDELPLEAPAGRLRLKSLAVSLVTTVIDAGLFAVCAALLPSAFRLPTPDCGLTLVWARWACGAIGAICNFTLNRAWAFRARRALILPQLGRYGVMALASVSLATLIWWLLRVATGLDPRLLHLLSLGLVWLCFSFPMLRGWVFRPGAREPC
jgi:putative flippase GtrA